MTRYKNRGDKMTIAYLIAAHTDPTQLGRLVNSLNNGKNDFYIHIDKKSNIAPFLCEMKDVDRVFFIPKRVKDYWGGFSHLCTLDHLLEEALKKKYDRLVYISGLDYPVWSNEKMEKFYRENPKQQLLCGYNITQCDNTLAQTKICHYAYWDIPIKNEKIFNKVRRKLNDILSYIPHPISFKVEGKWWDIYWGSDWWSLTNDCASYVYNTYHKYPEIKRFFRYTFSPNELWVQTIVANSPYHKEMEITDKYDFNIVTVLQHVEYTSKMKIWEEKDFQEIVDSGKMFVRKTTSDLSEKLCEKIDEYRNENTENL